MTDPKLSLWRYSVLHLRLHLVILQALLKAKQSLKKKIKKYPNDSYCRLKNNLGLFELFNRAEHLIKLNISKNITL